MKTALIAVVRGSALDKDSFETPSSGDMEPEGPGPGARQDFQGRVKDVSPQNLQPESFLAYEKCRNKDGAETAGTTNQWWPDLRSISLARTSP